MNINLYNVLILYQYRYWNKEENPFLLTIRTIHTVIWNSNVKGTLRARRDRRKLQFLSNLYRDLDSFQFMSKFPSEERQKSFAPFRTHRSKHSRQRKAKRRESKKRMGRNIDARDAFATKLSKRASETRWQARLLRWTQKMCKTAGGS